MIRIGIEASPLLVEQQTGIEHYVSALVAELTAVEDQFKDITFIFYFHAGNPFASRSKLDEVVELLSRKGSRYQVYHARRGFGIALSYYSRRDKLNLIHMLRGVGPRYGSCPYVLTIYDAISVGLTREERELEKSKDTDPRWATIKKANGIIYISESTRRDVQAFLEKNITAPTKVIYLGVDSRFFKNNQVEVSPWRESISPPYILFVGTIQYRKNLARLVEAFSILKVSRGIPHKLVLAGRDGWGAEQVYEKVIELGLQDEVLFPGYIADIDLPALYGGADVYAYPSLHEGFGIPILEAMASETVVVTSRIYSMPEVAADAVIYVDPRNTEDIAHGLWRGISDQALRSRLARMGVHRARQFTWLKNAQSTVEFYYQVVSGLNNHQ